MAVRAAHAGSARAAAAMARRASPAPIFGIAPSCSEVAGLCTGKVPPSIRGLPAAVDETLLAEKLWIFQLKGCRARPSGCAALEGMCHGESWIKSWVGLRGYPRSPNALNTALVATLQRSRIAVTPMPPAVHTEMRPRFALFSSRIFASVATMRVPVAANG